MTNLKGIHTKYIHIPFTAVMGAHRSMNFLEKGANFRGKNDLLFGNVSLIQGVNNLTNLGLIGLSQCF